MIVKVWKALRKTSLKELILATLQASSVLLYYKET